MTFARIIVTLGRLEAILQLIISSLGTVNPSQSETHAVSTPDLERRFEIDKLNYQTASGRYENLYKAVWTNFSYMTFIAAGTLSFGAARLYVPPLLAIAFAPLVFWYFATYIPLDRYGKQALRHLVEVERRMTTEYKVPVDHFTNFFNYHEGLRYRVSRVVHPVFLVIFAIFVVALGVSVRKYFRGDDLLRSSGPGVTLNVPESLLKSSEVVFRLQP